MCMKLVYKTYMYPEYISIYTYAQNMYACIHTDMLHASLHLCIYVCRGRYVFSLVGLQTAGDRDDDRHVLAQRGQEGGGRAKDVS